jgi:predicted RNA-binding Zn-ribbon protein involved in translation (DUF1610 family)
VSAFREALESQLVCPKCGALNIPGRSPTVHAEVGVVERAGCDQCGHEAPLIKFLRPSQLEHRT